MVDEVDELWVHMEGTLGPVEAGWGTSEGISGPWNIVRYRDGLGPGSVAFSTLGLSRHCLHSAADGRPVHLELLMLAVDSLMDGPLPAILDQIATGIHDAGHALLRGDVLGPYGPIVAGSTMEAFYVTHPVYFPDEFGSVNYRGTDVMIAWLIPISVREAAYVAKHGWMAFEDRLVENDPELIDFYRESLRI